MHNQVVVTGVRAWVATPRLTPASIRQPIVDWLSALGHQGICSRRLRGRMSVHTC
ncbi:hypothetical protein FB564_0904 [Salinispora arenicola]|uniref:Uncharacterized protein n=1 Tax=Salinispora arenicola TaxID=168697 RepID=A0A542XJ04_SALAC|nr:hypothetical protein FB564_0904 [Salinispora arenicola]